MNNQDYKHSPTSPLIRFSDSRRNVVKSKAQQGYFIRQSSILEVFVFNFVPVAITSTILAPLNRIKVILQVQNMIPGAENLTAKKVFKNLKDEEGILSLFRGNNSYTYKLLMKFTMKTVIFDRLKYYNQEFKSNVKKMRFRIYGFDFFMNIIYAVVASGVTLLVTHPFDLAYARIAGQYKPSSRNTIYYKNSRDTFHKAIPLDNVPFFRKYYDGLSYAALHSAVYSSILLVGFSLISYTNIEKKRENNSRGYMNIIGGPAIVALVTGAITYPLDTIKRQMQVSSAKGFNHISRDNLILDFKSSPKKYYNGFFIHMMRSLPFSYIQFIIYHSFVSLLNYRNEK
jgi:hypothetical protein